MDRKNSSEIATNLIDKIVKESLPEIENWANIVETLGLEESEYENWMSIYTDTVKDILKDLANDAKECQSNLLNKIENLLKKSCALSKQLQIPMESHGRENLGFFKEEKELRMKILELENLVEIRKSELIQIKTQLLNVCEVLGKKPMEICDNPLPTEEELSKIKNHVDMLEKEAEERKETFIKIRKEIIEKMNDMKLEPCLDFERMVVSSDIDNFSLSDESMKMLKTFHDSVLRQAENIISEIFDMREKISMLWQILSESDQYCTEFGCKYKGNSVDVIEALKKEISRCEAKKRANIKIYIDKIRIEMVKMWEKCAFTPEQRVFKYFTDNLYTEDLLNLHEIELDNLTKFYQDNKLIFELLEKREKYWNKMLELEEMAQAPDRYKNRGGKLLKEEKQRNVLIKKIPKIEENLMELSASYEIKHGKPFLYWGQEIDSFIMQAYEKLEEDKKFKLNTLKLKREISPMKNSTNLTKAISSQSLFKQTPLKRLKTPSTSARKHQNKLNISKNGSRSVPPKKYLSPNPKSDKNPKVRYSIGKKKRMEKFLRLSKLMKEKENIADLKYEAFETDLSDKGENCRSTLFVKPSFLLTTPHKSEKVLCTPKEKTGPRTLQNTPKHSAQAKLQF